MVETSARLLRLLALLEGRPEWPGADLAQRLDVTVRTLRRDVAKLRGLGYPVSSVPGVAGGYRLGAGAWMPPLLLDDDEAVAVALSLRTAATQSVTGLGEASVRALAKLEQVLPSRLRERAAAIGHATVPLAGTGPVLDAEALTTIARACRNHERLDFGYRSREGELTARRAEPHRLVQTGYRWYLVARDLDRGDWRTFRADRIEAPQLTGVRFVPVNPPDAAAFVARAITTAPYRYQARILLHAPAEAVAERVPPSVGIVEPAGPGLSVLVSGSDSLDALAFHVTTLDVDYVVLAPPELADRLAVLAARLATAAQASAAAQVGTACEASTASHASLTRQPS
jgi:predicted DNA-binding transcriptional regulator YafY